MALKVGQKAPDFILPSTKGKNFELYKTKASQPLIIYFYPKDFTPGCTKEACEFRDTFEFFRDAEIDVIGISKDNISTHLEFQKAHNLPFELLADLDGKVAKAYDALLPVINFTRRITYLLDKQHNIAAVYENLFGAKKHIDEMIKKVKEGKIGPK